MRRLTIATLVAVLAGVLALPVAAGAEPAAQAPVSGTIGLAPGAVGEMQMTPAGVIHQWGDTAQLSYAGDISGSVTCRYRRNTISADGLSLVFSCPVDGTYTWDGRPGPVAGALNGTCRADVPFEFSCSGTQVVHGSGALEGMTFRATWWGQPATGSFTYQGVAIAAHG